MSEQSTNRKLVLAISTHDLALAIMEGAIGLKAPPGTVAEGALREAAASEPEMVAGFYRAARNVAELLEREVNRDLVRVREVVAEWIVARRRELSKMGITSGHLHHDIMLLEQAMEASDAG